MTRSRSASSQRGGVELLAIDVLEGGGVGDVVEQVEADAVRLEAEAPRHHPTDEDAAGEVAEVARVVVRHEAARPGRADLTDAVDIALGGGQRGDPLAPLGPEEEGEVGLERGEARELVAEEHGSHRVLTHALAGALERVVDEIVLRDQRDVVLARPSPLRRSDMKPAVSLRECEPEERSRRAAEKDRISGMASV